MKMEWRLLLNTTRIKDLDESDSKEKLVQNDHRSEFQRDYDRCLFSTPVRRLQDKAQVFPLEPHDSVRTRLTHSLEVSNIAKAIAERVGYNLVEKKEIDKNQFEDIVYMASTCALIHDLGNPPFGHSGEDAMRDWFKKRINEIGDIVVKNEAHKQDFLNFEGNAQTIRLVSKLQMLGDFSGLNLTVGTLSASRKYIGPSDKFKEGEGQQYKKLGYFQSESSIINKVEELTGTQERRHPVTYLVEAADDIVYSVIDLEDGIKKGVLSWQEVRQELYGLIPEIIDRAEQNIFDRAVKQKFNPLSDIDELKNNAQKVVGGDEILIDKYVHQYCEFEELSGQSLSEARMNVLRTLLIGKNIKAVVNEFLGNYDQIMSGKYNDELVANPECEKIISACKDIAVKKIFNYPDILKLEIMGRNIVHELMDHFWDGIDRYPYNVKEGDVKKRKLYPFNYKIYTLLSSNYKAVFEYNFRNSDDGDKNYVKLQLLGDYICGMTDSFAKQLHKDVKNG